ncbi:hypothetical protein BJX61DRAFT_490003 [Aspergillus egyptiacus]|nr:hypothetical protein BJX61DRAFT_490003 [Aspergillus egyptiacus]
MPQKNNCMTKRNCKVWGSHTLFWWIAAKHEVHPEFLRPHLQRSPFSTSMDCDPYTYPALPSERTNIFQLPVSTVSHRDCLKEGPRLSNAEDLLYRMSDSAPQAPRMPSRVCQCTAQAGDIVQLPYTDWLSHK